MRPNRHGRRCCRALKRGWQTPRKRSRERVAMLGGKARNVLGYVWQQDAVALPDDEMRGIGRIDHIDGVNIAGIFLADPLKHAFRAGALDAH